MWPPCLGLCTRDWLTLWAAEWLIWAWQKAGKLWILPPKPGPHPLRTKGREKSEAQPTLPVASRKTSRNHWTSLNSAGSLLLFIFFLVPLFLSLFFFLLFFLPPSWTIRRGVTKCPETDWKGEHKANPQNQETETNVTLLSYWAGILLCTCCTFLKNPFIHQRTLRVFSYLSHFEYYSVRKKEACYLWQHGWAWRLLC